MKIIKRNHPDKKEFLGYSLDTDWAEVSRLRALIRYKTLCSELDNTDEDLQKLRPMLGNELRDSASNALFVKNGMNPETVYTQVHYIKGYFLLR
jgi:aminopeptidase O